MQGCDGYSKPSPAKSRTRPRIAVQVRLGALHCLTHLLGGGQLTILAEEETMELVGCLVYSLLKAASDEMEAGQTGSKAVRAAAMRAINYLVDTLTANNGEDTLAFLLPGVVSRLGQAILAAGQPPLSIWSHFFLLI